MANRPKMVDGVKSMSHPLYMTWVNMRRRCRDESYHAYSRYGGKGVTVCERWHTFANFVEDMGPKPEGATLDRIDGSGNYEPGNCRWATRETQNRNRNNVKRYDYDGRSLTIPEWAEVMGLTQGQLHDRINRYGWSVERALTTKVRKYGK